MLAENSKIKPEELIAVRIQCAPTDVVLTFDIYIEVSGSRVLFRRAGEVLPEIRWEGLLNHGVDKFFIRKDQLPLLRAALLRKAKDETSPMRIRGRFLKEAALHHIEELFAKRDVQPLIGESEELVNNLIEYVTATPAAAAALISLSSHDEYTYNHCVNVAIYTIAITQKVYGNDRDLLLLAGMGGLFHDLGMREIDPKILKKAEKLTEQEWAQIKRHPEQGVKLVGQHPSINEEIRRIMMDHHEHMDGSGYPRGIDLNKITRITRIASLADVFDAITSNRPYQKALSAKEAIKIMHSLQPGKFDPVLFKNFGRNF